MNCFVNQVVQTECKKKKKNNLELNHMGGALQLVSERQFVVGETKNTKMAARCI